MPRPTLLLAALAAWHAAVASGETVDYVVIGGGTAGCALAARLCAGLPDATVTLLERGRPRSAEEELLVRAPTFSGETWNNPNITEAWLSAPQAGLGGRPVDVWAGATLGGTSSINFAQWTRPQMAETLSWGVAGLTAAGAERLYGKAYRQLGVSEPPADLEQTYLREYLAANAAAGVTELEVPRGEGVDSVWHNRIAVTPEGRRMDSCSAYLTPVLDGVCRSNLKLIQGVTVSRLRLRGDRVTGVEYLQTEASGRERRQRLGVRNEAISCAGPYGSPKLLQLSGIGPAPLLESLGIPVAKDLPVGAAMQGRPVALTVGAYAGVPLAPEDNTTALYSPEAAAQFAAGDGGVLGVSVAMTTGALASGSYLIGLHRSLPVPYGAPDTPTVSTLCFANTSSRGTLAITSTDPKVNLGVDQGHLSDPADVARLVACIKRQREVFAAFESSFGMTTVAPGADVDEVDEAYVRATAANGQHIVGGCPLGDVLDPFLRVKGFTNLRVVDSSAIPSMPSNAGPMSSVYMLAEFIAEQIVRQHKAASA